MFARFKRLFDFAVSLAAVTLLGPAMMGIALLIRFTLGTPVLFRQRRPGLHGRPFMLLKFRSMSDRRDARGTLLPDASRMTPLGALLRRTSLDELPQLLNVLRGDMSLVGPRPLLMEYLPLYNAEQARRHLVKPGITGWAQIHGRNAVSWPERFRLDVWYVDHQSFLLDLRILVLTVRRVFDRRGIDQPGGVTMTPFSGNGNE